MLLGADSRRLECSVGKVESDILQIMSLLCGQQGRMPGPSRGGSPVCAAGKLRSLRVLQVFVEPSDRATNGVNLVFPLLKSMAFVWVVVRVHNLAVFL